MVSTTVLRRGFAGACVAWAGALPAATLVAASPAVRTPLYLFAVAVYAVGSVVCHQLPERSFHLWGRQLPVCARCTGIYAGAALAVMFRWGKSVFQDPRRRLVAQAFRPANSRRAALKGCATTETETSKLQPSADVTARARRLQPSVTALLAALPTAATLVFEWTTGVTPANWIRAAAGVILGGAVALLVARELAANPEVN
jgi:hypothetical protein